MAARPGKTRDAGLQRSRQPGPEGATPKPDPRTLHCTLSRSPACAPSRSGILRDSSGRSSICFSAMWDCPANPSGTRPRKGLWVARGSTRCPGASKPHCYRLVPAVTAPHSLTLWSGSLWRIQQALRA